MKDKEYRQKIKKLKKEHYKKFENPRYWWISIGMGITGIVGMFLSMITSSNLYDKLTPYTATCFIIVGIVTVLYAILNSGKVKGWYFFIFPAALCIIMGGAMLFMNQLQNEVVAFLSAYGFMGWALILISYGFLYKRVKGYYWIVIVVAGCLSLISPMFLVFHPYHDIFSVLQLTQLSFICLSLSSLISIIAMAVQYHFFIKLHPIGPIFIRE